MEGTSRPQGQAIPFSRLHRVLLQRLGYDSAALRARVKLVATLARNEWIRLAQQRFNDTRQVYTQAIQPIEWAGSTTAKVALVGAFPNMLERGAPPWDLRTTLLRSSKTVVSKKGFRYLAVPFRHKAKSLGGATPYQPMMGKAAAKALGKEISARARQLGATLTHPGANRTEWGGRLEVHDLGVQRLKDYHAGDIYTGMVRKEKTYQRATQNQYMTWRMISDNPATRRTTKSGSNWVHPGFQPANLLQKVRLYVSQQAPDVMVPAGEP